MTNPSYKPSVQLTAAGQAATYLALHGNSGDLTAVLAAIAQCWDVLASYGPTPCQAMSGCCRLNLVVLGEFYPADLADLTAGLDASTADTAYLN